VHILPITKPGKEDSTSVNKYRAISLLITCGKVLEKLLIKRIMRHMYYNFMSNSQYGFTPQKCKVNAAMALSKSIQEHLAQKRRIVFVALDVKGAFDAAWWPGMLNALRLSNRPRNLYKLSESYLDHRTIVLSTNSITIEREVTMGYPQG